MIKLTLSSENKIIIKSNIRISLFLNNDLSMSNYIRVVTQAPLGKFTLKWSFNDKNNFTQHPNKGNVNSVAPMARTNFF